MLVSRRIVFAVLALALLAAPALPTVSHSAHAQAADTITIGMTDLPTTLDPGEAYDFDAWEVLSHLYVGLTRQVPGTLNYELALASGVTVSDDKLIYTFTLRPDATFSDGTPITAQTFVDSIQRVLALRRDATLAVEPYVENVAAASDGTLVFTLKQPLPYFLALVALPPYFPQHPTLAATDRPQPYAENLIGNGPYALESFQVRDSIVLTANPTYTLGPQPATPRIVLLYFDRSQALRDAMRTHAIDIAWRGMYQGHLAQLEGLDGITVLDVPSTRVFYMYLGEDREPTDDPLVREGITLLVNRQPAIDDVLAGHATALTSLTPDLYPAAYIPRWPGTPDRPQAEAILRAAGYKDRGSLRLQVVIAFAQPLYGDPYATAVAHLGRDSFRESTFVDYAVQTNIESSTFMSVLEEGGTTVAVFAWTPLVPDTYAYYEPLFGSSHAMPVNGLYASPEIDALLAQAAVSDTPEEQTALYTSISDLLLQQHAIIPLWQDHIQLAAWDDIGGIQIEANYFLHYDQLARH